MQTAISDIFVRNLTRTIVEVGNTTLAPSEQKEVLFYSGEQIEEALFLQSKGRIVLLGSLPNGWDSTPIPLGGSIEMNDSIISDHETWSSEKIVSEMDVKIAMSASLYASQLIDDYDANLANKTWSQQKIEREILRLISQSSDVMDGGTF